jgi:hypothetical protein
MEKDDNSDKVCLSVKEKYTSEQPEEMVTNLKASVRELSVKVKEQVLCFFFPQQIKSLASILWCF